MLHNSGAVTQEQLDSHLPAFGRMHCTVLSFARSSPTSQLLTPFSLRSFTVRDRLALFLSALSRILEASLSLRFSPFSFPAFVSFCFRETLSMLLLPEFLIWVMTLYSGADVGEGSFSLSLYGCGFLHSVV